MESPFLSSSTSLSLQPKLAVIPSLHSPNATASLAFAHGWTKRRIPAPALRPIYGKLPAYAAIITGFEDPAKPVENRAALGGGQQTGLVVFIVLLHHP
jgi:hypothetical protein